MNYFPKTEYWSPLVPNSESVDKTTNPYFKNPRAKYVTEMKQSLVWFKNKHASVSLCSQQLPKILRSL